MTGAPPLSRLRLETLLVAHAVTSTDPEAILVALDRRRVSPAVFALLEAMIQTERADEERGPKTKGQRELADRARAITVWELLERSRASLIRQANALPAIARPRISALDIGTEDAA